jgi:hypothetical protein
LKNEILLKRANNFLQENYEEEDWNWVGDKFLIQFAFNNEDDKKRILAELKKGLFRRYYSKRRNERSYHFKTIFNRHEKNSNVRIHKKIGPQDTLRADFKKTMENKTKEQETMDRDKEDKEMDEVKQEEPDKEDNKRS